MNLVLINLMIAGIYSNSICDKYTKIIFQKNTQANQFKLLSSLVNTVVIGNFTPTVNNKIVPGILGPQNFMGQNFDLTGFFTGTKTDVNGGKTANINGQAKSVNFLDGGGANALKLGKASEIAGSRQERLLNHLYQLFGELTGCSKQGGKTFPKYSGNPSMADTHKFMGLNKAKLSFFNDMVGQAALGFGVSKYDAKLIVALLESLFNIQCALPAKITPHLDPRPQGSCFAKDCVVGKDKKCVKELFKAKKQLNPNIPPCFSTTSALYEITATTPTPQETTVISTDPEMQQTVYQTTPCLTSTPYAEPTTDTSLSYPTASAQFDMTDSTDSYESSLPIFSSGLKLTLNGYILIFSILLV